MLPLFRALHRFAPARAQGMGFCAMARMEPLWSPTMARGQVVRLPGVRMPGMSFSISVMLKVHVSQVTLL
jgi:hypothetical protein